MEHIYKGEKYIKTVGAWIENNRISVEYDKNGRLKKTHRAVRFDKQAGDLYITLNNMRYFYYEFE